MFGRFAGGVRKPQGYGKHLGAFTPSLVAFVAGLGALLAVTNLAFLKNFDNFLSDWEIGAFSPTEAQDSNIVIAAITEDTLKSFPYRSPIDRQFLSGLLLTLEERGARAIVVDILFDQATETEKDALLRQTLEEVKIPVFVGYTEATNVVTESQQAFLDEFVPVKNRSMVTIVADQFGTVRWVSPGQLTRDGEFVPSFSHSSAAVADVHAPREQIPIVWHGQPDPETPAFAQYPAHLAGILPAEWFKDKFVLIGIDVGLTDRHRTPVTNVTNIEQGMAGIAIHAHSLATLLDDRRSAAASIWINLLLACALALCGAALGVANWPLLLRATLSIVLILIFWAGGIALFNSGGAMVGLLSPVLAFGAAFWTMEALNQREMRRQREFVKETFSRYVAPKVVDTLIGRPDLVPAEGERRIMTFLFTDIADFTTMAEGAETGVLTRVLNAYLDGMTVIVHKHGGIVDKFIGDAVFAIFNALIDQPDHAECAVRCGLEKDRFSQDFRVQQKKQNLDIGITRIGINTGMAVVGNFGSKARFDYTAQGDAVNTAARLEGLNKYLGTRICVSETT